MYSLKKALPIYSNKDLFEEIHQAKNSFLALLENISNRIELNELNIVHPSQKGIKISKGNELEHCPYQVLDLIRDFDPESGLNIRLLHWWGYGMFLFVLVGEDFFDREQRKNFLTHELLQGFAISGVSSHFSYKQIIEDYYLKTNLSLDSNQNYSQLGRFQLVKQIPFGGDFIETEECLFSEITRLLLVFQNVERR